MRISDWSSDVCSSDLRHCADQFGDNGIGERRWRGPPEFGERLDEAATEIIDRVAENRPRGGGEAARFLAEHGERARCFDAMPHPVGQIIVDQQIGSASCRERVCLYV